MKQTLNLTILGAGTVGGGVLRILNEEFDVLASRAGKTLQVLHIVKQDASKLEGIPKCYHHLVHQNWQQAITDENTDIVIELMGGKKTAMDCIQLAIDVGKPVITANKCLLAETLQTKMDVTEEANLKNVPLKYEAAIAGCIPIVKVLRESLAGDYISSVYGIINGTCNYILSAMAAGGSGDFATILKQAQIKGYAEADPSLDIEGIDAAHKILLIAHLAFGVKITMDKIKVIGIRDFDSRDVTYGNQFGYTIKLLAVAKYYHGDKPEFELRVRPTMIPQSHPLAKVDGANNAILLHSRYAGETLYYGAGAGAYPTAVAVLSDVIDITLRQENKTTIMPKESFFQDNFISPFYLRLGVIDRPGVLADVTRTLANNEVSIEAIHQNESDFNRPVDVVILTHAKEEQKIKKSIESINALSTVTTPVVAIPIERLI